MNLLQNSEVLYKKQDVPDLCVGDTVRITIYLELPKKVDSEEKKAKERIQAYEGVIIAKHLNIKQIGATITVRKIFQGVGMEKVFLLNSPWIKSINVISRAKVRRAKLYYLRNRTGKAARLKTRFS
jgi:large subunit ribosomal protein L19|tara:strand:+ start:119 stop:496 length:378 start_codon:yes stop_codon:yes gene_type:complete